MQYCRRAKVANPVDDGSGAGARLRPPARWISTLTRGSGLAARSLADLIMPPVCAACRLPIADHNTLCPTCWRSITFIRPPLCDRLGIPLPYDTGGVQVSAQAAADPPDYDRARAVALYAGAMRELIRDLKFHDRHYALPLLGRWLAEAGRDLVCDADVIVPVPLNRWRLLSRRFNQSALLASELSRHSGLGTHPLALKRTRATASQVGKTREQRRLNVRGAFVVPPSEAVVIAGRAVLLVDDVLTTGATVGAAARALRAGGATRIDVLTLALATGDDLSSA